MYKRRVQKSSKRRMVVIVIALFFVIFSGGFAPFVSEETATALISMSAVGVLSIFFFSLL